MNTFRGWSQKLLGALLIALLSGLAACGGPTNGGTPRHGTLGKIEGTVELRPTTSGDFVAATNGVTWDVGAQLRTGADGFVRVTLADGTLLRLGPNTLLTNNSLPNDWQFSLEHGIVWAVLYGQHIVMVTPLGQTSAGGTAVAFKYDPAAEAATSDDRWTIQCLRGNCQFQNAAQSIALTDLGQLVVADDGATLGQSSASRTDVSDFITHNSEAANSLAGVRAAAPAPSDTPSPTALPGVDTATPAALNTFPPATQPATLSATPTSSPTRTRVLTLAPTWTSRAVQPTDTAAPPPTNPPPPPSTSTNPPPTVIPPTNTPVPPTNTPLPPTEEPTRIPETKTP